MHEDEKDTDNLAVYKNTDILNDDTDIEKSLKEPDAIDLGIIGSANWRIDSTGTLHISEGDMGIGSVAGKWAEYASEIKKLVSMVKYSQLRICQSYFGAKSSYRN